MVRQIVFVSHTSCFVESYISFPIFQVVSYSLIPRCTHDTRCVSTNPEYRGQPCLPNNRSFFVNKTTNVLVLHTQIDRLTSTLEYYVRKRVVVWLFEKSDPRKHRLDTCNGFHNEAALSTPNVVSPVVRYGALESCGGHTCGLSIP